MKCINHKAPVKYSTSSLIHAPANKVWEVMTNIESWPQWQKEISKTKIKGAIKPGSSFEWKSSGISIHSTLHTVVPASQFGWEGKSLGIFAIHNWTIKEKNGKTEVLMEGSMEGFLAGLFKKSFNKNLEKGMVSWLELLKKECEK